MELTTANTKFGPQGSNFKRKPKFLTLNFSFKNIFKILKLKLKSKCSILIDSTALQVLIPLSKF